MVETLNKLYIHDVCVSGCCRDFYFFIFYYSIMGGTLSNLPYMIQYFSYGNTASPATTTSYPKTTTKFPTTTSTKVYHSTDEFNKDIDDKTILKTTKPLNYGCFVKLEDILTVKKNLKSIRTKDSYIL
jgi:hypothetical protein